MNNALYNDALNIANYAISKVKPKELLGNINIPKVSGKTYLVAIGKAAYQMSKEVIKHTSINKGIIITKYAHSEEKLNNIDIFEAGHPIVDQNSIIATDECIKLVSNLKSDDLVIFLISGGGSSLFESPLIPLKKLQDINNKLLKSGAKINEINTIRKRLSKVKGGKFAKIISPARVFNIIISDVINDKTDMIASGPTINDSSNKEDAIKIINKYSIDLPKDVLALLNNDCVNNLDNVETHIIGNNKLLVEAAALKAKELGYEVIKIDEPLTYDIKEACQKMLSYIDDSKKKSIVIAGGEIVLKVSGNGLGGRNQELALRLAKELKTNNRASLCVGSDGTDGPSDAAGAIVSIDEIDEYVDSYLSRNDSYHYLDKHNCLIKIGPSGTNVCDLYCIITNNN